MSVRPTRAGWAAYMRWYRSAYPAIAQRELIVQTARPPGAELAAVLRRVTGSGLRLTAAVGRIMTPTGENRLPQ